MPLGGYYDRQGQQISLWQWAELIERPFDEYRRIALTEINSDWQVSTVWLGINHNFLDDGSPPLIFETMIFTRGEDGRVAEDCWRWPTEAAALAGHDQAVAWVEFQLAHPMESAGELEQDEHQDQDHQDPDHQRDSAVDGHDSPPRR